MFTLFTKTERKNESCLLNFSRLAADRTRWERKETKAQGRTLQNAARRVLGTVHCNERSIRPDTCKMLGTRQKAPQSLERRPRTVS